MSINKEIELQALITEREGMIAENQYRIGLNQTIAYCEDSFMVLSERIRDLKELKL